MFEILCSILIILIILLTIKYTRNIKVLTYTINSLFKTPDGQIYYIKDNSIITPDYYTKTMSHHNLVNGFYHDSKIHVLTQKSQILILDEKLSLVDKIKVPVRGDWIGYHNNEFWVGKHKSVNCYNQDWKPIGKWTLPASTFGLFHKGHLYLQTGKGYLLETILEPTLDAATVIREIPVKFTGHFTIIKKTIYGINSGRSFIMHKLNF